MSRIVKFPIKVPKQVNIKIKKNLIQVVGPKGHLTLKIPKEINIIFKNRFITFEKTYETKLVSEKYGLIRTKLVKMIRGVYNISHLGKLPIKVPKQVNIEIKKNLIQVVGPEGKLTLKIPKEINIILNRCGITVSKTEKTKGTHTKIKVIRQRLRNMIRGVRKKFEHKLLMYGISYYARCWGTNQVRLYLGLTNTFTYTIPEGIQVILADHKLVWDGKIIIIKGCDKEKVDLFASRVLATPPPVPVVVPFRIDMVNSTYTGMFTHRYA
jgi:large subunit ribosomal protein L6